MALTPPYQMTNSTIDEEDQEEDTPFQFNGKKQTLTKQQSLTYACVGLCNDDDNDEDEGGNDPLIRELDLDAVAALVPVDLLEPSQQQPSQQEPSQHEHTPSSSDQTPTPTPEAHSQGGEREVHILTL